MPGQHTQSNIVQHPPPAQCNIQLKSPTKLTKLPVEPKLYHSQTLLQTQFQPKLTPHTNFVYQDVTHLDKNKHLHGGGEEKKKEIDKINLFFFLYFPHNAKDNNQ